MLDGMNVTLYAMAIAELLREFRLPPAHAGLLASLTLIASAAGGILSGVLADRAGRRRDGARPAPLGMARGVLRGILPALVTLWIRRGVEESPLWAYRRPVAAHSKPSVAGTCPLPTPYCLLAPVTCNLLPGI
jgi:MFS family permease